MTARIEEVVPFLIAVVDKYGVTVFDWRSKTVHRPPE
jgi:hypothetical protein